MRVLVYDNDFNSIEVLCHQVHSMPMDTFIDKVSDTRDFIDLFNRHDYDSLIIDVDDEIGKKLLKEILTIKPKQKIVTIGDTIQCGDENGCEHCLNHHKKIRLMKPVTDNDLFYALHNISFCHQYCSDSSAIVKLKNIDKKLKCFEFDLQYKAFINKNNFLNGRDDELDILLSMLEYEGFEYQFDNARNIYIQI